MFRVWKGIFGAGFGKTQQKCFDWKEDSTACYPGSWIHQNLGTRCVFFSLVSGIRKNESSSCKWVVKQAFSSVSYESKL